MTTEQTHDMLRKLHRRRFSGIPDPTKDINALYQTVLAMKENIELIMGERTDPNVAVTKAVTWGDLFELGLIEEGQLPTGRSRA